MSASKILGVLQTTIKKTEHKSAYKTAFCYFDSKGRKRYTGHKINLKRSGILAKQLALQFYGAAFFLFLLLFFFFFFLSLSLVLSICWPPNSLYIDGVNAVFVVVVVV